MPLVVLSIPVTDTNVSHHPKLFQHIYFRKDDFICNYYGGLVWVGKLEWSGKDAYNKQTMKEWSVLGKKLVHMLLEVLYFSEVDKAGHMVPMNQPEKALGMLDEFMKKDGFPTPKKVIIKEVF